MQLNPGISGLENFRDPEIQESRDPGIAIPSGRVLLQASSITVSCNNMFGFLVHYCGRNRQCGFT